MTFTASVTIDGVPYTRGQLDRYEYERALHMLHELQYLGVDVIAADGGVYSHEDLNWLEPAELHQLAYDTRYRLGVEKIVEIFTDAMTRTDARWRQWATRPIEEQGTRIFQSEYRFTGVRINPDLTFSLADAPQDGPKLHSHMMGNPRGGIEVFAEHYGPGMETIGMLGEPMLARPVPVRGIPDYIAYSRDESFPIGGAMELALRDGTAIHIGVLHEYRPEDDGFTQRSTLWLPADAPAAIGEGHKIHFALEMVNDLALSYQELTQATVA